VAQSIRQAVVVIHGMGEQRPLETLNGFIGAALPRDPAGEWEFYSRPDTVTDSYESRVFLAPRYPKEGPEVYTQTEFYEYHWAHLMQANQLGDLWPTFSHLLLEWPWRVPRGLRVLWLAIWALIGAAVWYFWLGPGARFELASLTLGGFLGGLVGGGLAAVALTYVMTHILPTWLTSSFVDVVRYLDTSPRSFQVRRDIREGILNLLQGLHDKHRYQRIVIVAHSLGSYIAYDAITYLWSHMAQNPRGRGTVQLSTDPPAGLDELQRTAGELIDGTGSLDAFRDAQRALWLGIRHQGNPWLITDFISLGSPMYFADQLYTRNHRDFCDRVDRRELPQCPPLPNLPDKHVAGHPPRYAWHYRDKPWYLYHAAPFAVVRWTNFWFPAHLSFFGDWFGDSLTRLFGKGIKEIPLAGNRPWRFVPGLAHALYFSFKKDPSPASVTTLLQEELGLASSSWLRETMPDRAPLPAPDRDIRGPDLGPHGTEED
jgi:hypothetical protein